MNKSSFLRKETLPAGSSETVYVRMRMCVCFPGVNICTPSHDMSTNLTNIQRAFGVRLLGHTYCVRDMPAMRLGRVLDIYRCTIKQED